MTGPPDGLRRKIVQRIVLRPVSADVDRQIQAALRRQWFRENAISLTVALGLHALVLFILSLFVLQVELLQVLPAIVTAITPDEPTLPELAEVRLEQPEIISDQPMSEVLSTVPVPAQDVSSLNINDLADSLPPPETMADSGADAPLRGELAGRSAAGKQAALNRFGGTAESEAAVQRGLVWLKRHQKADGSWSFDHRCPDCDDSCSQPGSFARSTMGATSMALLAYLGSGSSSIDGPWQSTVEAGLNHLAKNANATPDGLDLRGTFDGNGGLYIQGLATICLSEAVAMNELALKSAKASDKTIGVKPRLQVVDDTRRLKAAVQNAVQFITKAQDPSGGGWRYSPREPGDTSVVGWQVMGLVSAKSVGIAIPSRTTNGIDDFLRRVQVDEGSGYGYMEPRIKPSTTAIGLLCRMYRGWRPDRPPLQRGVKYLSNLGPARDDMYYNYYATQVMHQWGGAEWKKWNEVMREQLVTTQIRTGHAEGSWNVADPHGGPGGRLYMTCLAIMTLEVYYRHLPLYQRQVER